MPKMNPWIIIIPVIAAVWFLLWFFAPEAKAEDKTWNPSREPIDIPRMIRAIKLVENWDGKAIGASGERGAMQWKESTWRQFSAKPLRWAGWKRDMALRETARVEDEYVRWLIGTCQKLHRHPTPYLIGLLHNAGMSCLSAMHPSASQKDFAQRTSNVYDDSQTP